jgi:hypothetical protein
MKKIVEFWKVNEHWLTFLGMVIYLNGFWIVFLEEMREKDWMAGIWLVQFFGLATWYGLRGRKKGWRLPKFIRDTH